MSFILRAWPIVREKEGNRPGPLEWCKGSVALTRGQGREAEPYNKPIKIGLLPLFPVKNICSKAPAPYNNTYIFFIIFKEYIRGWASWHKILIKSYKLIQKSYYIVMKKSIKINYKVIFGLIIEYIMCLLVCYTRI